MDSGQRTELVLFQRRMATPDGMGGETVAWVEIGRAWAAMKWVGGDEVERNGAVRHRSKYRATIPAAAADDLALTPKDRLVWGSEVYDIRDRPRRVPASADTEIYVETADDV